MISNAECLDVLQIMRVAEGGDVITFQRLAAAL